MERVRYLTLTAAIILLGTSQSLAQNKIGVARGENQSKTMQVVKMARELVNYGQQNQDPYALVSAANMLMQYKVEDAGEDRVDADEGKSDASDEEIKGSGLQPIELDAAAILAEAERYAERNSSIMRVISDLKIQAGAGSRGYAHGSGYVKVTEDIPAYGSREFNWTFTGDEFAEILFVGESETDIDVYVYDTKTGEELGKDETHESGAYFSWTPPQTKQYTFRVVNRGAYVNTTYILSN